MTVPKIPKMLTEEFLPGLGIEHEVGASGLGVSVVDTTVCANSARTAAELIASPPNTAGVGSCGPIVHSLGATPTIAMLQYRAAAESTSTTLGSLTFQLCTADHSAVYFWARTFTGAVLPGAPVRMTAIR